jgi:hypothetical protein
MLLLKVAASISELKADHKEVIGGLPLLFDYQLIYRRSDLDPIQLVQARFYIRAL